MSLDFRLLSLLVLYHKKTKSQHCRGIHLLLKIILIFEDGVFFLFFDKFSETFEGSFEVVEENYGKVSLIVTDNTNGIRYKARTTTAKLIDFMFVGEGIQGHTYTGTIRVVSNGDNGLIVPPKKKA